MPLTKATAPLDPATQALVDEARPLSDYRLRFTNPDYPALSLLYAIYAGGEHALYCDHGEDFFTAYLIDAVVDGARKDADAHVEAVRAKGDKAAIAAAHHDADARVDAARAGAIDAAKTLGQSFDALLLKRARMTTRPPAEQEPIVMGTKEIDAVLRVVRAELLRTAPDVPPAPMW